MSWILDFDVATVVFAMLGKLLIGVCATTTIVYSNELFPTEIRSAGISSASMCSRIISTAAAYFGGPLVSTAATGNAIDYGTAIVVDTFKTKAGAFIGITLNTPVRSNDKNVQINVKLLNVYNYII